MNWYSSDIEDVKKKLGTGDYGLEQKDVEIRTFSYGENKLDDGRQQSLFMRFLLQLKDYMAIILITAAIISIIINIVEKNNNWAEPVIILAVVILNAVLGVFHENKAEEALEALKNISSPTTKVLRDGALSTVKSTAVVPGDIIVLEQGDLIPADARLLESASLRCDESPLTGESEPVEKDSDVLVAEDASPGDRINMVYSGCSVTYGKATAIVTETGMNTEIGKIAAMLSDRSGVLTPLQQKLSRLGKLTAIITLGICFVVFVAGLISGTELSKIFAGFVSLAVAAVPEGLTAVVTVVLALGVARMIKKKSIIRRLSAIETLGSASVVCTDKTGTLTQNKMTVVKLWTGDELIDAEDEWTLDAELLITYAALCSDASVTLREDGSRSETGDPTERAIIGAALEKDIDRNILMTRYPRLYEIPFDSERKLMTSVHRIKDRNLAIVKGAPDVLVSRCGNADREAVFDCNDGMAKNALRVIAVAYKFLDDDFSSVSNDRIESGLTFMGLIGLIDPPRPEALKAIKQCESAGIRPIMITGDHVVTASAIARQLGILTDDTRSITGAQLAKISDEEFENTVQNYSVYARVTPHDKLRIVKAWQKKGEVVAMTGDGVNDAPALKAADIGCAMGKSGTDVAKGAADIVISDDNFSTIVAAVREGRGLYENIKKSVHFLLSCNLGELLCIFLSMLIYGLSPLRSVHLLFINLLVCGLPALTLGMEPLEKDVMRRAPRSKNETVFADGTGVGVAWQGALLGILTIIAYAVGRGASPEAGRAMAFAVLSFGQLFHAFSLRSRKPVIRIGLLSNRLLIGALGISALLTLLVLLVPPFASLFSLAALSGNLWLAAVLLSAAPLVIGETVKVVVPLINKKLQKTLESDF